MIHYKTKQEAIGGRKLVRSGTGEEHWRTDFLIAQELSGDLNKTSPQAFLIEMTPEEVIQPHFHEVEQFQVFLEGEGQLGRSSDGIRPTVVHYTDAYTGYGPITASEYGLSYFALRPRKDPGAIYLHKEGYRERLRPSLKRHFTIPVIKSTEPVLAHLKQPVVESLFDETQYVLADGLAGSIVRLGPRQVYDQTCPEKTGGQYVIVLQGQLNTLDHQEVDQSFQGWTVLFAEPGTGPVSLVAGDLGAEFLVLQFGQRL
ncbi:hypothetical protein [Zwartia sp.]|uniref:hypothetical protein n=1 Tax=Zwartia sp. TaxID=2978004 RepID=UPI002717EDF1|nr:hypothetical protein [Zwartia sp.]MDO9024338.1 hypothetical protein [Zwartia sp.]